MRDKYRARVAERPLSVSHWPITLSTQRQQRAARPASHWGSTMSRDLYGALERARDLLCTPLALEVLDDLAQGRSPYERPEKSKVITGAVRCLVSLGAAAQSSLSAMSSQPSVEITPRGRTLYERLVEIEEWAARDEAYNATVASGSS